MTNDLTLTNPGKSVTRWSPPALSPRLAGLLADRDLWADRDGRLPALSADDRAEAERALAIYAAAPRGASPERIASLMGEAAGVMPTRTGGEAEETLRVRVYQADLAHVDGDVLKRAFAEARRTLTFFPTIADILAIVGRLPAPPRVIAAWRLRQLLAADPEEAAPAPVAAEDVAALLADLGAPAPEVAEPQRAARSAPTVADYEALGLSHDEAEQAWRDQQRILGRDRSIGTVIKSKAA